MQMYVNTNHLIELFYSESQLFDLEGKLFVRTELNKQKQPSSTTTTTTTTGNYQKCFCRLRGNLLLIADISTFINSISNLSICLVILNNFQIKLTEVSAQDEFCITLNNNHNNKSNQYVEKYYFICNSRSERDKWVENINLVSFNFLKPIYQVYSENFNKKRNNEIIFTKSFEVNVQLSTINSLNNNNNNNNLFILIKCNNLLITPTIDPFVYVKVFYRKLYIDQYWHYLGSTEVIQSKSPQFDCAINLPDQLVQQANLKLELKFELYNIVEQVFDTSYLAAYGYFIFYYNKVFNNSNNNYNFCNKVKLCTLDNNNHLFKGILSFTVFRNHFGNNKLRKSFSLEEFPYSKLDFTAKTSNFQIKGSLPNLTMNCDNDQFYNMGSSFTDDPYNIFNNTICKKFLFKTHSNSSFIILEEFMSESKFVFLIPQILM